MILKIHTRKRPKKYIGKYLGGGLMNDWTLYNAQWGQRYRDTKVAFFVIGGLNKKFSLKCMVKFRSKYTLLLFRITIHLHRIGLTRQRCLWKIGWEDFFFKFSLSFLAEFPCSQDKIAGISNYILCYSPPALS